MPKNREREIEIARLKIALEKLEKEGGSASEGLLKKVNPWKRTLFFQRLEKKFATRTL